MAGITEQQAFWDRFALYDPLWAILSDPSKTGRQWDLASFMETGRREVSLLMHELQTMGIAFDRTAALDFGCGVGRLTIPLADHFDAVFGVDVSNEMVRLARHLNPHQDRVRFLCNPHEDLREVETGSLSFLYFNVVLQHIEPAGAMRYLEEFLRVVQPGGVLVFQLPSHERPPEERPASPTPMPDAGYRAGIRLAESLPAEVLPGTDLVVKLLVTNTGPTTWKQSDVGSIRVGNHWLTGGGERMLVQDDGRAPMPDVMDSGSASEVRLTVTVPSEPGNYVLECDAVHEGISWFADKGSPTLRVPVGAGGVAAPDPAPVETPVSIPASSELDLPDIEEVAAPGSLPMHGIPREQVEALVRDRGATIVRIDIDERCGAEWVGYRYVVRNRS